VQRGADKDLIASVGISVPARRFTAERHTLTGIIREIAAEATAELSAPADDLPPALLEHRPDGVPEP
jgi:hypothetical protein